MPKLTGTMGFPLTWPQDRKRTQARKRERSPFGVNFGVACDRLLNELRKMGARYAVISSNVPGYERQGVWRPYADSGQPDDPAVAVYFDLDGDAICLCCDQWKKVVDNVRAIGLTVEAMRGLERWGAAERKRAFQGFKALPASGDDWRTVLGIAGSPDLGAVKQKYRQLAAAAHPDQGGNPHEMSRINQAFDAAKKELAS